MTAAETYAARIDAVRAQRARLHGAPPPDDPWGGPIAQRFRADPHRPLDANLTALHSLQDRALLALAIAESHGPAEMTSELFSSKAVSRPDEDRFGCPAREPKRRRVSPSTHPVESWVPR